MIQFEQKTPKCSKCDKSDIEHVTHNHCKFIRCRACGHEGIKSNIMPDIGSDSSFVYKDNRPRKF